MKVLAILIVFVASVSAKGSGPYLPSGWRPAGRAFYLPSEVQNPAEIPIKEIFAGTEASGTDALSEYGPPRIDVPSKVIINQGLPGLDVEQNFIDAVFTTKDEVNEISSFVEDKDVVANPEVTSNFKEITTEAPKPVDDQESTEQSDRNQVEASEAIPESNQHEDLTTSQPTQKYIIKGEEQVIILSHEINKSESKLQTKLNVEKVSVEDPILNLKGDTDSVNNINKSIDASESIAEFYQSEDLTTSQSTQEIIGGESENIVPNKEDGILTVTEFIDGALQQSESTTAIYDLNLIKEELENTEEQIRNLEEIILNMSETAVDLEKHVKPEIADSQTLATAPSLEASGLDILPEGFLEYGPPGFKEYGPPKDELDIEGDQDKLLQNSIDTNEPRRRRFSPKFKPTKNI